MTSGPSVNRRPSLLPGNVWSDVEAPCTQRRSLSCRSPCQLPHSVDDYQVSASACPEPHPVQPCRSPDTRQAFWPVRQLFWPARCLKKFVTEAELLPHTDVTEIRSLPHDGVTQTTEAWTWSQRSAQPRGQKFSEPSAAGTGRLRRETRAGCSTSSWPSLSRAGEYGLLGCHGIAPRCCPAVRTLSLGDCPTGQGCRV